MQYALLLNKTGQTAEALSVYNRGVSLLDYEDSQYNGGNSYLKVLLPEMVMQPTSPSQVQYTSEHLQALADTALAHENHDAKEERAQAQEAVKLFPESPVTHYYLGEVLLRANDPAQRLRIRRQRNLGMTRRLRRRRSG